MATVLNTLATEESTYVITASFTDDDGVAVVPSVVTWTLTDTRGTVINSRSAVSVTPAASVDIVLSGNDLSIGTYGADRLLTVNATYDSDAGSNLPLVAACHFIIADLVTVT